MTSRDYFKDKRIAVIGLGKDGEMVEDVKFLIKAGALVSVYDLKSEARLKTHLIFLRSIGLANYVCGSIPADDLLDMDMIVLSHEYSRSSSFLEKVNDSKNHKIAIEYPETLFFKQAPIVTVVGVFGVCGKSTVISMLSPMLESACAAIEGQGFYVMDPDSGNGIISRLKKVRSGDVVLFRIKDEMMKELHAIRISPQVAICPTPPSAGSYGKSPFEILAYQTYNNFIIGSDEIIDLVRAHASPKAKMLRTKTTIIPSDWEIGGVLPGLESTRRIHDKENAALALQAARLFKVNDNIARDILKKWKPLRGRMEFVKNVKGIEFYNDTASSSAYGTETALRTLSYSPNRNIILILGGAKTDGDYERLYELVPSHAHTVVLLPGSGTLHERSRISKIENIAVYSASSVEHAVDLAMERAQKGDRILFSPGFDAIAFEGSKKERGERFVRTVRGL